MFCQLMPTTLVARRHLRNLEAQLFGAMATAGVLSTLLEACPPANHALFQLVVTKAKLYNLHLVMVTKYLLTLEPQAAQSNASKSVHAANIAGEKHLLADRLFRAKTLVGNLADDCDCFWNTKTARAWGVPNEAPHVNDTFGKQKRRYLTWRWLDGRTSHPLAPRILHQVDQKRMDIKNITSVLQAFQGVGKPKFCYTKEPPEDTTVCSPSKPSEWKSNRS